MLTESVLLELMGGLFGVVISFWATHAMIAIRLPAPVPLDLAVHQDRRGPAFFPAPTTIRLAIVSNEVLFDSYGVRRLW